MPGSRHLVRWVGYVTIHTADILKTDLTALRDTNETLDVVGNLPYYITSDILLHLFTAARLGIVARAVVMMQREVADRIAAKPDPAPVIARARGERERSSCGEALVAGLAPFPAARYAGCSRGRAAAWIANSFPLGGRWCFDPNRPARSTI